MKYVLYIVVVILIFSCKSENSILRNNVSVELSTYEDNNRTKASVIPILKEGSELMAFKRRFDYLLLNIPEIHSIDKIKTRDSINSLYPDTSKIKELYLSSYCEDIKLEKYFDATYNAIKNTNTSKEKYTTDELMEVASKFFYCDQVNADTSIQMHVCIGLNGIKEANWNKDYTLLSAFTFEAIFNDLDMDKSKLRDAYSTEHKLAVNQFKKDISSLDTYLLDVRKALFIGMKNNKVLKETLLAYYELNKDNLTFTIDK